MQASSHSLSSESDDRAGIRSRCARRCLLEEIPAAMRGAVLCALSAVLAAAGRRGRAVAEEGGPPRGTSPSWSPCHGAPARHPAAVWFSSCERAGRARFGVSSNPRCRTGLSRRADAHGQADRGRVFCARRREGGGGAPAAREEDQDQAQLLAGSAELLPGL